MSLRRHPQLPALSAECDEGRHDECPIITVTRPQEIDEVGCACDCHPFYYPASGGGAEHDGDDDGPVGAPKV